VTHADGETRRNQHATRAFQKRFITKSPKYVEY
jgi:hypothetical protein